MKQSRIQGQMSMRFHKFLWKVSIPLGFLTLFGRLVNTLMEMTRFNWLYLVDFFYFAVSLGLMLACFIGFFQMKAYSWYGIISYLGVQVGYALFGSVFCAVAVPDSLPDYLGQLLVAVLYAVPVGIYYQKRKPLFVPPRWAPPAAAAEAPAEEKLCPCCGRSLRADDCFCQFCGAAQPLPAPVPAELPDLEQPAEDANREEPAPPEAYREEAGAKAAPNAREKTARWLIAALAVLCVISCTASVVLLVQRNRERTEAARLQEAVEAKLLELQEAAASEPEPEPEPVVQEPEQSDVDRLALAAESVLYLETYDENGDYLASASGFLTGIRTLVTNYHVVQDAYEVYGWTTDDEGVMISTLLAYDETADLAVLQCDWPPSACVLALADSDEVKQGLPVYAVGYPLGLANTMSNGIVSARYIDEYGIDTIQHTAAISGGSSGGPLLNGDGEVVGVNCAYYVDGQNLNVAVASNTLQELLSQKPDPILLTEWTDRPLMPDQELWEEPEAEESAPQPQAEPDPEPQPEQTMVPTGIRLNYDCCFVTLGESLNLVAMIEPSNAITNILWTSSDPERISVEGGTVTVKSINGASAIITAQTDTGLCATCKIIVRSDIQPYRSSSAGFVYEKYPEILSIENVVGDDQSIGFWSESDSDYTATHFYTYQVKASEQAETYVVAYVRFLVGNGYVLSESNADYYIYGLIDPTGTYEVQVRKEDPYYAHTLDVWISPVGS